MSTEPNTTIETSHGQEDIGKFFPFFKIEKSLIPQEESSVNRLLDELWSTSIMVPGVNRSDSKCEINGQSYPTRWGSLFSKTNYVLQSEATIITSEIECVLNSLLTAGIRIPVIPEVREYLTCYSDILKVLQTACRIAPERLGRETQLSLEVYHDPEIEDRYLRLVARSKQYDDAFLNAIDKIFDEYEQDLADSTGWFIVSTDFNPPK
jgi:hypothetical protein